MSDKYYVCVGVAKFLEEEVTTLLEHGWELYGNIVVIIPEPNEILFAQTMLYRESETNESHS